MSKHGIIDELYLIRVMKLLFHDTIVKWGSLLNAIFWCNELSLDL